MEKQYTSERFKKVTIEVDLGEDYPTPAKLKRFWQLAEDLYNYVAAWRKRVDRELNE
jgi:hypothetical protein